jgi:hypothetical protein
VAQTPSTNWFKPLFVLYVAKNKRNYFYTKQKQSEIILFCPSEKQAKFYFVYVETKRN